jgi:acyl carrier protein
VSEVDTVYQLQVLKMIINQYLDRDISITEESLQVLEANPDPIVWELATRIYGESGHKVELRMVREIVDDRIRTIKYKLAQYKPEENLQAYTPKLEEAISENKITSVISKYGLDRSKALIFIRVARIVSKQLEVDESKINLESNLSDDLGADELEIHPVIYALEDEFDIEINGEDEDILGISIPSSFGSSWGSMSSQSYYAPWSGKTYELSFRGGTVSGFVDLIHQKISV